MAVTIDGVGEINGVVLPTTGFGKVLQVVRATDSTDRTTTSTSFVDASISVTITPQKSTSAVLLIYSTRTTPASNNFIRIQITDSSNNAISGAQSSVFGGSTIGSGAAVTTIIGYATPATTSAVTFKGRFHTELAGTATLPNSQHTGQLYAIEVSA